MVITDLLEKSAKTYNNDSALVEINPSEERDKDVKWNELNLVENGPEDASYRRELTWGDFDNNANKVANLLLEKGLKRNTKVGILLMNCLEFLPIYFGILKAGLIVVPMNYRYSSDEIKYCLDLADVEALIFGEEFISRMDQIKDDITKTKIKLFVGKNTPDYAKNIIELCKNSSSIKPNIELNETDLAAIYFSSGTTGFPKAILHNHKGLYCSCLTEQNHHKQTKDDCFLCIPPLYHTGAKMHWFGSLLVGGKTVLLKGIKPKWILETIDKEHCTIVWLLVPWAQDMLDAIERNDIDLKNYSLDQWRLMHIGAQPVPPSLIKRWKKVFPHHGYDTNYGLSESLGPGCVHLGIENIDKVGAIGKPGYLWEAKVVNEKLEEVKTEEVGELMVKGPGVMLEYYKNPEATKEIKRGDWLLTGDMAKVDKDGFIFLVDRKKDVIITGGENLYPVQIEDFLRAHTKIKDVAVIGIPDKRLGEVAAAIIEVKDGFDLSEEEVIEFLEGLPRYKRPKKIIFEKIPRNPTGKIEKPVLREKYCHGRLVEAQNNG